MTNNAMLKMLFDRDRMYPYPFYLADLALTSDMEPIIGMNLDMSFGIIQDGRINMHYDIDILNKMGSLVLEKLLNGERFFEPVKEEIYARSQMMEEFSTSLQGLDVSKQSDDELLAILARYIKLTRELRAWGWIPVILDGMGEPHLTDSIQSELVKNLKVSGEEGKSAEYYSVMSSSEKPSEVQQEGRARLRLLADISRRPDAQQVMFLIKGLDVKSLGRYPEVMALLDRHLADYGWLTYAYSGPPMDLGQLLKALKSDLEGLDVEEQLAAFDRHYSGLAGRKAELTARLGLPEELVRLFRISADFMHIKDFRKGVYQRSYLAMDKVMGELARRLDLDLKQIKHMTYEEMAQALQDEDRTKYRSLTERRIKKCALVVKDGVIKIFEGQACEELIRQMLVAPSESDDKALESRELKGMVAFAGQAQGKVKIVLVPEDVDKVESGDILVSSATNPDLIVAMKRAAAIVTDMGGITSHAAIVSRELRTPCIVGTKVATKVLKDGDEVVVDAVKGVVTIK